MKPLSERIRDYLATHPESHGETCAEALGEECRIVKHTMAKMAKAGLLVHDGYARRKYSLGRPPAFVFSCRATHSPEERKALKNAAESRRRKARRAARRAAGIAPAKQKTPRVAKPSRTPQEATGKAPQATKRQGAATPIAGAVTIAPKQAFPDTEAAIAAGVPYEVIPSTWVPPTKYPRPGFRGANL